MGKDTRAAITQAKFNEESYGNLAGFYGLAATVFGLYFQSWGVFGGVLIFGLLGFIPGLTLLVSGVSSIAAGLFVYIIGMAFLSDADFNNPIWTIKPETGPVVIGCIAALATMGLHLSAVEHIRDISSNL